MGTLPTLPYALSGPQLGLKTVTDSSEPSLSEPSLLGCDKLGENETEEPVKVPTRRRRQCLGPGSGPLGPAESLVRRPGCKGSPGSLQRPGRGDPASEIGSFRRRDVLCRYGALKGSSAGHPLQTGLLIRPLRNYRLGNR